MQRLEALQGRRILIIEDDFMIVEIVREILEDAGAIVLNPIGTRDEALAFISGNHAAFDAAVVDLNLHGRATYPIADALLDRKIPFVFATGYSADAIDSKYECFPRCEKPFRAGALLAALAAGGAMTGPPSENSRARG